MSQLLKKLSDQDLLERLADLTDRLAFCRGMNISYDFCMMDIEETLAEIESRKPVHTEGTPKQT